MQIESVHLIRKSNPHCGERLQFCPKYPHILTGTYGVRKDGTPYTSGMEEGDSLLITYRYRADDCWGKDSWIPYQFTWTYHNSKTGEKSMASQMTHYIVVGSAGAATYPHKHTTLQDAEREAKRLANANPTQTFTIYEANRSFEVRSPLIETIYSNIPF